MAASSLNVLSGILSAVAGFAGDKVTSGGKIPGLDIASIVPALLGQKAEGASGLLGGIVSAVSKSGLLKNVDLGSLAELAGSLFTAGKATAKKAGSGEGIAGLAAAIMGNSGKGADLAAIGKMALGLAGTAKNDKEVTGLATSLGKTLSGDFGLSFSGGASALKALGDVIPDETKSGLLKAALKGIGK